MILLFLSSFSQEDEKTALKVVKQTDDTFIRTLSTALQVGLPILIEGVGEYLDNVLEPVLLKQTFKSGVRTMIRLGSEVLAFDPAFRLYITTKSDNDSCEPRTAHDQQTMFFRFMCSLNFFLFFFFDFFFFSDCRTLTTLRRRPPR